MAFKNQGLTSDEASKLLQKYGLNELPTAKPKNILAIVLEVLKEPMFILLVACGSLYFVLGDTTEGVILLCWVFVIIFITFYQSLKTEKALNVLKQLASPKALVVRDGHEIVISGRELVPGDIVILNEGDRIPADGKLISSNHLMVDESLLTGESVAVLKSETVELGKSNMVFSGTLVVQGRAVVEVLYTGQQTQLGMIGKSLQTIEQGGTRLQVEMKSLIKNLFFIGGGLSVVVIAAFYFTRGGFVLALMNGLGTAMAMLPEEFPVVLTVFLAIGSWRLSKRNILTKKATAIENLGSITVLCSDKTGTITENKMHVASVYVNGKIIINKDFQILSQEITPLFFCSFYASREHSVDPMEDAIKSAASDFDFDNSNIGKLIKEYPLSNEYFGMTRVLQSGNSDCIAYCKGAPEVIIQQCNLMSEELIHIKQILFQLANEGKRVLAVAKTKLHQNELPLKQQEFKFSFEGFLAFEDPIRKGVQESVMDCHNAGIKVMMITGDNETTALSIAKQAGINSDGGVLTGAELNQLTVEELRVKLTTTNVFARIIPEQKLKIIEALKLNGEVVAMTGDGVNDAPALKAADVAIAMGSRGTDVARETADLVLLDDNFNSIVDSIRLGRKIYDNLQKALAYIVSIHIPIIGLTLVPAFFSGLPILLLPLHIVFLELIIDPVCSIAFESESEELNVMKRFPRKKDERFFGLNKILESVIIGLFLFFIVLGVYFVSINEGHSASEVRAVTFTSLILGNVFLSITMISKTRNIFNVLREGNTSLYILVSTAFLFLILLLTNDYLNQLFGFGKLGLSHFVIAASGSVMVLFILEIYKLSKAKKELP
jgi:Ca2+-transporting ATPase